MRSMRIFDERFKRSPWQYILQSLLAFLVIAAIIIGLGALTHGIVVAALGASAFIVFAMPRHDTARARNLIGGHGVCMAIGFLCSVPLRFGWLPWSGLSVGLGAAAAVGLAIFLMAATNTEHPPAAGNALAFAISTVEIEHVFFTICAVVFLSLARRVLWHWLKDLA